MADSRSEIMGEYPKVSRNSKYPYRKYSTRLVELASWRAGQLGFARSAGRPAKRPGPPWLARSGLNWLDLAAPGALAVSIWPRMARSACSWHPCWVDLAALCGPGRPTGSIWLPNECPIDTISQKNRFAYRRSCFDAACFVRSDTFLHASNLVCYRIFYETPLKTPQKPDTAPPDTRGGPQVA